MARHPAARLAKRLARTTALPVVLVLAAVSWGQAAEEPSELEAPRLLHAKSPQAAPPGRSTARSPFQPAAVSSQVRRLMLQFEALVEDEAWDEAIDLVERLAAEHGDELIASGQDNKAASSGQPPERFVPLATRRGRLLEGLPPEGRQAYRDRVERSARRRLDEAASRLDERGLARLADEYAASEAASEALLLQGELALERGDTAAARHCFSRLTPLALDPWGRPAAATLLTLDPEAPASQLGAAWIDFDRPPEAMSAGVDPAIETTALARLALTSLREGDLNRAEAEVRLLQATAPEATGRLAGREQPLADTLTQMINAERSATADRYPPSPQDLAWAWPKAVLYVPSPVIPRNQPVRRQVVLNAQGLRQVVVTNPNTLATDSGPPRLALATHGGSAYYLELPGLTRVDLATGETTSVNAPGAADEPPGTNGQPNPTDLAAVLQRQGGIRVARGQAGRLDPRLAQRLRQNRAPQRRLRPPLTIAGDVLYGVLSAPAFGNRRTPIPNGYPGEELIGLDLAQESKVVVRIAAPADTGPGQQAVNMRGYGFGGPPVVRDDRLYVVLSRRGVRTDLAVACYALPAGRELWRTDVGSGEPSQLMSFAEPASVTLAGDTLYVATNLGAVAALDAADGQTRWLSTYERTGASTRHNGPAPARPCVVTGDVVLAAPADSSRLFAWDAGSGRPLWEAARSDQTATLCGVHRGPNGMVVALAGERVAAFDALTGQRRFIWPESRRAGLRGLGRATVVGAELFWPTRGALYAIDLATGRFTRPPIDLTPVGAAGANVVAAGDSLIVAGPKLIQRLAPRPPEDAPASEPTATGVRLNQGSTHPDRSAAPAERLVLAPRP